MKPDRISTEQESLLKVLDETIALADAAAIDLRSGKGSAASLTFFAALSAVNRADDVYYLLRAGIGGAVAAALARGLLEQACCEVWLADNSSTGEARLVSLGQERRRLVDLAAASDLEVTNMVRWLGPWPLMGADNLDGVAGLPNLQQDLSRTARKTVSTLTHLPSGVADLLAMSSHANIAGALATVGSDGHPIGLSLTPEWAAVVAQVAGISVAVATHVQPGDGADPVTDLVLAAQAIHRIPDQDDADETADKPMAGNAKPGDYDTVEVLPPGPNQDALLERLLADASVVHDLLSRAPSPWDTKEGGELKMAVVLPYLSCLATADVALSAANGATTGASATTAARMLLEEAARLQWQGLGRNDAELWDRYVAVADRATQGRQLLRQRLGEAGTPDAALRALFEPTTLGSAGVSDKRRTPPNERAPQALRPGQLLADLGVGWAEPKWFEFAYSLLSQVVHATPLGDLHLVGRELASGRLTLSHEMTALAVDCACLGATTIATRLAAVIEVSSNMPGRVEWAQQLTIAAARVHSTARLLHFLD